ncbi:TPA: hypothetical protein ACKONR_000386 [Clostridioides difficile]|uniref:hypothetical protein n=1 Tax=Clostridioides difficile TaxID=1496 RepID=UPI00107EB6F3|nr:hypothetical protein [Clostridioides difficile]MDV9854144.1 hypothetical protein [Clostridioides difficile]TGA17807.1 hypothetical protein E5F39_12220 [Clostridioides difficile]TGA44222.1 hypothetical protein E5F32_20485 [Clostridioides difficile]HBE9726962.1 hypothetical protein [Clostridioides difficile]HBF1102437.1 hypothetical protein [Clostridioides difficile]
MIYHNKKIETYFIDGIEYYKSNHRMVYNKEFHGKHRKNWSIKELSYLCKMRPYMNWKNLSMALERTQSTCMNKYNELKKINKIDFYKNI